MKKIVYKVTGNTAASDKSFSLSDMRIKVFVADEEYEITFEDAKTERIPIKLLNCGRIQVSVDDIVMMRPAKDWNSARSNNKEIVINGFGSDSLCDFSPSRQLTSLFGERSRNFVEIKRGTWVNVKYSTTLDREGNLAMEYATVNGEKVVETIAVSRRKLRPLRQILLEKAKNADR